MDTLERWAAIMALPGYRPDLHALAVLLFKDDTKTIEGIGKYFDLCAPTTASTPASMADAYEARRTAYMSKDEDGNTITVAGILGGGTKQAPGATWKKAIAKVNANPPMAGGFGIG